MSEENQGILTIALWFLSAIVLAALFIAAAAQGELTSAHVALASVMLILATIGTVTIWRMKKTHTAISNNMGPNEISNCISKEARGCVT